MFNTFLQFCIALKNTRFYVKFFECSFATSSVEYLRHVTSAAVWQQILRKLSVWLIGSGFKIWIQICIAILRIWVIFVSILGRYFMYLNPLALHILFQILKVRTFIFLIKMSSMNSINWLYNFIYKTNQNSSDFYSSLSNKFS